MKLAIVSHTCIKAINRSVYYKLASINDDVELYFITPKSVRKGELIVASEKEENDEHTLIRLDQIGEGLRKYTLSGLAEKLNEINPDIVLLENDPVSRIGISLSKWTSQRGKKLFCLTNDNFSRSIKESYKRGGVKTTIQDQIINSQHKKIAKNIDGLFVVNKEGKNIFSQKGYENKVYQIPLGYDDTYFFAQREAQSQFKTRHNITSDTVIISYFGRIIKEKGIHLLIDALEKLKDENWFFLIDSFEANGEYQENIMEKLNSDVFRDRILKFEAGHGEIAKYMQVTDIAVAPSLCTPQFKEQYGRVVPEAMACGCTVVSSNSGQLPDLVGDAGLVFESGNVPSLTEKISYLLQNKERLHQLKQKAEQRAKLFSLSQQTKILNQALLNR